MANLKRKYWLVRTMGQKWLVYDLFKELDKPWNSRMHFTKKKLYATRYETEAYAQNAIKYFQMYSKSQELLIVEEIWE